jgi:lipoate-protein ligase A
MPPFEYPCFSPEENLAIDEYLLLKAEKGLGSGGIRFWESSQVFVVLGRTGEPGYECYPDRCAADGVKVLRRISGGGSVLQGPGCFNYSVILPYRKEVPKLGIEASYAYVLNKVLNVLRVLGIKAVRQGLSDLAAGDMKFSGNAQARKKRYFLHHGTILYDFDTRLIEKYLKHPPKEPVYRGNRVHSSFVSNIKLKTGLFVKEMEKTFGMRENADIGRASREFRELLERRYLSDEWNRSF